MSVFGSKKVHLIVLGLILASLWSMAASEEQISCSGFVRPSAALSKSVKTKVDLSSVRVKLVSAAGFVTFEGAPDPNGYYIVPVDAHNGAQKLVVQAPAGWTFQPSSAALSLANGECNSNQEINFELTGFRVSGIVKSSSQCSSGSIAHGDKQVDLLGAGDAIIATVKSEKADGSFFFENVAPGAYTVRTAGTSVPITVVSGNLEIRPEIFASGYTLCGAIEPANVDVVLYSHSSDLVLPCGNMDLKKYVRSNRWGNPVCVVKSDEIGKYKFDFPIPCGQYVVAPFSQDGLRFGPEYLDVTIDNAPGCTSKTPFKIVGADFKGKVVNAKNKPVSDVQITLKSSNGATLSTTTNEQGIYQLENVPIEKLEVKAEKKGFSFIIPDLSASKSFLHIPDITVDKVDICGKISIPHPPSGAAGGAQRKVNLKNAGPTVLQTTSDAQGHFCFQVPAEANARNVVLEPVVAAYERKAGLLLSSFEQIVSVDTVPVVNVHFAQALLAIRGQVRCLSKPCDQRLAIQLTPVAGGESITTGLTPTSVQDGQAGFEFPMLVPGKYVVKMEKSEWCWQQDSFEVELNDVNFETLEFVQTGYQLRISASHDIEISYANDKKPESKTALPTFKLQKTQNTGSNNFCLSEPGTYTLTPVSTLFQFDQDTYSFSTEEAHTLTTALKVNAKRVKVSGQISVPDALHKTVVESIITRRGEKLEPQFIATTEKASTSNMKTLEYFVWAEAGDELEIHPASKSMLYYPLHATLKVPAVLESGLSFPSIEGRPGLFIKGSVTPAVDDVTITVIDETDGDKVVLEGITTDKNGKYSAGPLFDTHTYRVEAKAPGFHLAQQPSATPTDEAAKTSLITMDFKASKLGSLKVKVVDAQDASLPIVGALLSMSGGGGGYRANSASNEAGEVLFANIFPGEYYLMPLLKEYTFAKDKKPEGEIPRHQHPISITVKEGADSLTLVGSRIAFSCFGKVTSLNGQPERGVYIEAKSGELMEKAQTDQSGSYRLRGLVPGQTYAVHVTTQGSHVERTSPSEYSLLIAQGDVHNKDFLAFRKSSSRFEVFGHVITNTTLLPYITVQLWEEDASAPVREVKLFENADFFAFAGLSKNKYSLKLKLDSSLNKAHYSINTDGATKQISFADEPSVYTSLILGADPANEVVEIPAGQLYATILAIAAFFGFYYRKPITKFIKAKKVSSSSDKTPKKARKADGEDKFVANLNKFGKTSPQPHH